MQQGMAHMVIFRRPDGKPGYHQADSVEDAIRFVEMLRNQEKVTDARIFRMEEVPIEVRTYYRVEVAGEQAPQPEAPNPAPDAAPNAVPANRCADSGSVAPSVDCMITNVEIGAQCASGNLSSLAMSNDTIAATAVRAACVSDEAFLPLASSPRIPTCLP